MSRRRLAFWISLLLPSAAWASPELSLPDRIRISEALRLGGEIGDEIWPGWSKTPFALLLVTHDTEFLVGHPKPSEDFVSLGHDALIGGDVYHRARQFAPDLQATFPAVSGTSTIVIGTPGHTGLGSTEWVVTVLHEHFHQYQTSWPEYYAAVDALALAGDDESGMWMLDYPFPYDSDIVADQARGLALELREALLSIGDEELAKRTADFLSARQRLVDALSPADYRYLSFQTWQEGIARYTQYRVARWASENFAPSDRLRSLPDYLSFGEVSASLKRQILSELENLELSIQQRVVFYPLGAAEGLLLDAVSPGWQARYFEEALELEAHFDRGE